MLQACIPDDPASVLRRVFGFPGFRGQQQAAVEHVVGGGDALVLMPTGGGKSICYQVPALCRPGTAVIISPLIALMDDQVAAMRQVGVNAGALHSELDPDEARGVARALNEQRLDLLYVSPERLLGSGTLERLSRLPLSLFAIDEAHCVSQWGHEFRPEYRGLACLPEHFPGVPRIALTATADPRTRTDILAALGMPEAEIFVSSFHRPNLHLGAAAKVGETAQLLEFLAAQQGACGIVYCGSRVKTERVATKLTERASRRSRFMPGCHRRSSGLRWRVSGPASRLSWSRQSLLAWGSTALTSGSSCTSICPTAPKPIISRSAARDAMAIRPTRCCFMVARTWRRPAIGWPNPPPLNPRSG